MDGLDLKALQTMVGNNPGMKTSEKDVKPIIDEQITTMIEEQKEEYSEILELDNAEEFTKSLPKDKVKKEVVDDKEEIESKKKATEPEELEEVNLEEQTNETTNTEEDGYKSWASVWKDKGFIDFEDKEYDEAEDKEAFIYEKFDTKYQEDVLKATEEYKANQPEFIKKLMDLRDDDFDITQVIRSEIAIKSYEKIDPEKLKENVDLQKKVVKDLLFKSGAVDNEKEADSEISELEENGLLEKKADKALPKLVQIERKMAQEDLKFQEQEKKRVVKEYHDWVKSTNEYIEKNSEILPGIKLTKQEQKTIADMLTKVDNQNKTGLSKAIEKDPMKFNVLASYFKLNNWNIDKLEKAATTKATQKIKETVNTKIEKKDENKPNLDIFKKALKIK